MIGCKNKVLRFIYVLIYEDNFPVFSTCVEVIPIDDRYEFDTVGILYMRRGDSNSPAVGLQKHEYSLHA